MEDFTDDDAGAGYELEHCSGHGFHKECIRQQLVLNGKCAICSYFYICTMGTQPVNGTMTHVIQPPGRCPLSGYHGIGTIVISYHFPNGVQGPEHPHPGVRYAGTSRTAYLPDNSEGREVLALLNTCFKRRMTFTGLFCAMRNSRQKEIIA